MTSEIKPHKVPSPAEMSDTLDAIRDVQAEVVCHVKTWLHHPRPEVDERFMAARQRETAMLEQIMVFDRRNWNKGRPPADEAEALGCRAGAGAACLMLMEHTVNMRCAVSVFTNPIFRGVRPILCRNPLGKISVDKTHIKTITCNNLGPSF
jgi:hypothetical protein